MAEDYVARLRHLARYPDLKSGHIVRGDEQGVLCESNWSGRNLLELKRVETVCCQHVLGAAATPPRHTPLLDNVEYVARSGERAAYLVQSGGGDKKEPVVRYILVQQPGGGPATSIDLAKSKHHGKVYTDGELGGLVFSADGTMLAFPAEEYRPEPCSFLAPEDEGVENKGRGEQFTSLPDWGEQFTGKHKSVAVVVPCNDATNGRLMFAPPPEFASVGQLVWAGPRSLMGVAYLDASPRLGLIYCRIRESVLFHVSLDDGTFKELTPRGWWVGSPRLSPDLQTLVYLRGPVGGPHIREAQLVTRPWGADPQLDGTVSRVVVDYQASEVPLSGSSAGAVWAGLTGASSLPQRCFLKGGTMVALTTHGRFTLQALAVDLASGRVSSLLNDSVSADRSEQVLDVCEDLLLLAYSSFTSTASLALAKVAPAQDGTDIKVEVVCRLVEGRGVEGIPCEWMAQWLLADKPPHPVAKYDVVPIPVLYCGPTQQQEGASPRPLILFPHGGPHSAVSNSHILSVSLFVSLGYCVVFPGYRGSLGLGSDGIHSLPGHCGDIDVRDCHAVAQECLNRFEGVLDPKNVFLYGGSHGGYLVTSLSAKYPEFYRAVCARNPVTDIATMAGITDIPDWTHLEAGTGAPYPATSPPSHAALTKMAAASPLWSIDAVKAPTLLQLGSQDRRVPHSQGLKYAELLRHRGVPTRVTVYPDCHPLGKVEHEVDMLLHTLRWFRKHGLRIVSA